MKNMLAETFRSLRVRNYRLFATGQLTSLFGRWMQIIAVDWIVLELSGDSGAALGIATTLQFVPVLLLSLHGGKLADRYQKRRLLQVFNVSWLVLSTALAINVLSGGAVLWHMYVFSLLLGVVNALENPVRQSFVSEIVGKNLLPNALALSAATFSSARIVGPAIGGILIALFGSGSVIAINAVCYVAPVVCLAMMNRSQLLTAAGPAKDTRIREGVRYAFNRADLMLPLTLMFVIGGLGFNFPITLALLSKSVFNTGAGTFGLLTTMLAVGALFGALMSSKRSSRPSAHIVLGTAAAFSLLEFLVGIAPFYWTAAFVLIPCGFAMSFLAQAANQRIQLGVDSAHRGRVMALYVLVFLGSTTIFAPIIGWLSETIGPRSGLWIPGLVGLAVTAVAFGARCYLRNIRVGVTWRPWPRLRLREQPAAVEQTA